jgi:hypothetical protein
VACLVVRGVGLDLHDDPADAVDEQRRADERERDRVDVPREEARPDGG